MGFHTKLQNLTAMKFSSYHFMTAAHFKKHDQKTVLISKKTKGNKINILKITD